MSNSNSIHAIATITRTDLAAAFTFASLGLSKRPALPVLGGVVVTITAAGVDLAAFDYETTARMSVPCDTAGEARFLADGHELAAAVKSLPKGKNVTAEITAEANRLMVDCEGTQAIVSSLPLEEYPQLPVLPEVTGLADGAAFTRSALRVAAAAGTDDTLPVLLCVQMASDSGELELAATDRYRLAVDRVHWTGPDGVTALIPAATLAKFAKTADRHGKIALHVGEGFTGFSDGARTLITRTLDREFPRYKSFIRGDHDTVVTAGAAKLEAAVARAGKIAERNSRTGFAVGDTAVTVTATVNGQAASTQAVPAVIDGPPQDFGFNAGYLASLLAGFSGDVRIGLKVNTRTATDYNGERHTTSSEAPAVLTADGDPFTAVLMPIRRPQ
jgi:DNA polymerase-3 subunit beta